jgi:hypothetical protein
LIVADKHPSFFGPIVKNAGGPPAFSDEELQRIRARRVEADLALANGSAWPRERRFETIYPPFSRPARPSAPAVVAPERVVSGVRIVV